MISNNYRTEYKVKLPFLKNKHLISIKKKLVIPVYIPTSQETIVMVS